MNPRNVASAVQFAAKGAIVLAAFVLGFEHMLTIQLAATLAAALLSLGMSNGASILSRAAAIGAAASAATIAASIPPPPGPSPPAPPIPKPPPVPIVPLAVLALALLCFALLACAASQKEVREIGEYQIEKSACYDAASELVGMRCLEAVKRGHCGPGGIWYGTGLCSSVEFTSADGGLTP